VPELDATAPMYLGSQPVHKKALRARQHDLAMGTGSDEEEESTESDDDDDETDCRWEVICEGSLTETVSTKFPKPPCRIFWCVPSPGRH